MLALAPNPTMMMLEFQNEMMRNSVKYLGYVTGADTVSFSECNAENFLLRKHLCAPNTSKV